MCCTSDLRQCAAPGPFKSHPPLPENDIWGEDYANTNIPIPLQPMPATTTKKSTKSTKMVVKRSFKGSKPPTLRPVDARSSFRIAATMNGLPRPMRKSLKRRKPSAKLLPTTTKPKPVLPRLERGNLTRLLGRNQFPLVDLWGRSNRLLLRKH